MIPRPKHHAIGEEAEPAYSRMAIPYFLNGSIPDQGHPSAQAGDQLTSATAFI